MIEFQGVRKDYGGKTALSDFTLTVRPGELFALLGPNGAGKTTALKLAVGLRRPTAGRVLIAGHDVEREGLAARRALGFVPDEPFLYDKLTGREFLFFVARMHGLAPAAAAEGLGELEARFEMGDYLDHLCETYSHGMRQRVVISAALLPRPAVLVVDEPLVGLDPRSARLLKVIFRKRAAEGAAVLLSTHTLTLAESLADRIGILQEGVLKFTGTHEELRRRAGGGRDLEEVFLQLTGSGEVLGGDG